MARCKYCKQLYQKQFSMQKCCTEVACVMKNLEVTKAKQEKAAAKVRYKNLQTRREALKTRSDYAGEAQTMVNSWVRARDYGKKCISCNSILKSEVLGGAFDAGHYRSRGGAPHLRYDTRNIHGQCKKCNRYLGGNVAQMRIGMVERLGVEVVEALESDNAIRKFTKDELKSIRDYYKHLLKNQIYDDGIGKANPCAPEHRDNGY